jgi:hypothetical protein
MKKSNLKKLMQTMILPLFLLMLSSFSAFHARPTENNRQQDTENLQLGRLYRRGLADGIS